MQFRVRLDRIFFLPIQGLICPFGTQPGYFLSIKLRANTKHRNMLEGLLLILLKYPSQQTSDFGYK